MGLSASAYNLLRYTRRKNDIGCQLTLLSTQRQSLTRDMQKLSKKFQTEMNTKTLKWTTNGGYDYKDLSYATLMSPGAFNNSKLYMITDMNGRVVVDSKYRQYAQMISSDGAPGGTYDDNRRNQILGALLGKNPTDIGDAFDAYNKYLSLKTKLGEKPKPEPSDYKGYYSSAAKGLKETSEWSGFAETEITSTSDLSTFINNFKSNMNKYFPHNKADFNSKCKDVEDVDSANLSSENPITKKEVASHLADALNDLGCYNPPEDYLTYQDDLEKWNNQNGAIEDEMNAAFDTYSSVFDSNAMAQATFYDKLFSSIAENGWKYYDNLSDPDYLNNMFLNGCFNITTVERDCTEDSTGYTYDNEYFTEPALNCENIIQVNDKDHNNQVYIIYEAEKAKITAKEEKIDERMEKLKTEQSAIKEMIESVQNVMNTNVEKHFNIFG